MRDGPATSASDGHVDGLRGHDGAGGETVEVLALDGAVDDGDVGVAGGAADRAGDVGVER